MKCYTFCVSTLVNEPLVETVAETETPEIDVVDESVITDLPLEEAIGESVDEAGSLESLAVTETEEAFDSNNEASEASADVIALKPEDLADIKNKVDNGSEETIDTIDAISTTELSQDEALETESLETEVLEIESDEMIEAVAQVDTSDAEVEEESISEEVAELETVELEAVALEEVEAPEEAVALEESEEDVEEEASDDEAKPSRSRALLLTSLLSTTKPISQKELKKVLKLSPKGVLAAIEDLKTTLYEQDLGLMMEEVAGGYRVIIQPNLYTDLAALISPPPLPQLSSAALETLAIISYKQPITRGELEAARGTGCSSTLDTLQERDLIKILGQKDVVGKPLLYGTTERFLLEFGLKSLEDLPPLDEKPTEFLRS